MSQSSDGRNVIGQNVIGTLNCLTNDELILRLATKSRILFIQGSIQDQVDNNLWMEVYTMVFIISTRETEMNAYQILCDLCKEPPKCSFNMLNDVNVFPNRKPLLHLIWVVNHISRSVPRELKLKLFSESRNIDLEKGYNAVFSAFRYLSRYWIPNARGEHRDGNYLWGDKLLKHYNANTDIKLQLD